MKYKTLIEFIEANFPHINLEEAEILRASGKLCPLCDLKSLGNCQGIAIIPPEIHLKDEQYYWETTPRIKSCANCSFHRKNCERC